LGSPQHSFEIYPSLVLFQIYKMEKVIISTPSELSILIEQSLKKVLSEATNQNEKSEGELLNISQAASYLNLAKQTLYGFTSKGEIPFLKRGKKLYFKKSELTKWINEGKKA
jgi:excisionase family DNA binding protein